MKGKKISFIGGGNMAEAIIKGLLFKKVMMPEQIIVSEPREDRAHFLTEKYQVRVIFDNQLAIQEGEIIILAVKPQVMQEVLKEISEIVSEIALMKSKKPKEHQEE